MSALFDNINLLRKQSGITFRELSQKTNLPMPTLFGLKKRDNPGTKVVSALADALDVSIDELLGREKIASLQNEVQLAKIPVWKLEGFNMETPKYRYLTQDYGKNTFGIILGASEGYPKGTIMYFNPDLGLRSEGIVLIKENEHYLIRRHIKDGAKALFGHLKYDIFESYENYDLLGICVLIVTDPYSASFDE